MNDLRQQHPKGINAMAVLLLCFTGLEASK